MDAYCLDRSPVHLLYRALQSAGLIFSQRTTMGLTPRQLAVLMTVAEHDGANQTELTAMTGIDRSTVAEVVKRLVRKSLLQRRRSRSDTRAWALKATNEGLEAMHSAELVELIVNARVLAALTKVDGETIMACLQAIVAGTMPRVQVRERPPSRRPRRRLQAEYSAPWRLLAAETKFCTVSPVIWLR